VKTRPDKKCVECAGVGEIIYKPERVTNLQSLASQTFWAYYSENKTLPDSCGFLDHVAIFEDVIILGSRVKKFYSDKDKQVSEDLKRINKMSKGG